MRSVTIKEAKAHLNELINAASRGEQIVLLRGSKHVAAIVPISEADLELVIPLSNAQAERLWKDLAAERAAGRVATFESPEAAVQRLKAGSRRRGAAARKPRAAGRR